MTHFLVGAPGGRQRVAVMAHRGASRVERENTLVAFRRAADMGADAVELDVRRTLDGQLVVHHDPSLADGRAIIAVRRDDLPGHVPTLTESLDACGSMWVNVEIKNDPSEADFDPTDDVAEQVARALVLRGDASRYLVSSFRRETIDRFRSVAPDIATAFLTADPRLASDESVVDEVLDSLRAAGHVAIHPWYGLATREFIGAAHQRGIAVNAWTCDAPDDMRRLIAAGVDGICTNLPDVAMVVVSER